MKKVKKRSCHIRINTEEPPPGRIRETELSVNFRKEIVFFIFLRVRFGACPQGLILYEPFFI